MKTRRVGNRLNASIYNSAIKTQEGSENDMKLFRGNGRHSEAIPADSTHKLEGYAAGNVTIERLPKEQGRRVEIVLIACDTGETLFKASYKTHFQSDFPAFEDAKVRINDYLVEEKLVLHDELTTNADLPSISVHQRGGRWR